MKKIIILLMAVSIMLTSCGKSAGLSNRNKGADNKTLSAVSSFKGNLPQITDGKNDIKQSLKIFANEYKTAIGVFAVVAVIAVGAFFVRKWIINNKLPKGLKPLPEVTIDYKVNYFVGRIPDFNKWFFNRYPVQRFLKQYPVQSLIFAYRSQFTHPDWLPYIMDNISSRGYNVSTLII
jgi:hypothetical protein